MKVTKIGNYLEARKYVRETFCKAEDHAATVFLCAVWAVQSMAAMRALAETGEKREINPFPDPSMRTFEQLGRELDKLLSDVNEKMPEFKQEETENE